MLKYVECPRDSWQGLETFIPTEVKTRYLQTLLDSGFRHLDMGSFVSPKAVPQLADTEEVLAGLTVPKDAEMLGIVANERGLERALASPKLTSIGYPLSVNDTFQQRNTNRSLAASWPLVERMVAEAGRLNLVVYLSMGFGNPYGEAWEPQDTARAVAKLRDLSVSQIALADTVGTATVERLEQVLENIDAPEQLGLHLHARPDAWQPQLEVALEHGLRWFEGALAGVGGCPFAGDELVGNLPTELVLPWLEAKKTTRLVPLETVRALSQNAANLAARYS
ncbi:hydroxymethylglutaryl-CoA lyase [soil metagenome]